MCSLKNEDIEEVLKRAPKRLSAVGDISGVMELLVKCTIDLSVKLEKTSEEIKKFNSSTTFLTRVMIALTAILAIATAVGAYAAICQM